MIDIALAVGAAFVLGLTIGFALRRRRLHVEVDVGNGNDHPAH